MRKDFSNCRALIYDEDGELLASVRILAYDRIENTIKVQNLPALDSKKKCEVLILATPRPYMYKGTIYKTPINKADSGKLIRLYREKATENRSEPRYKIDLLTNIEDMVFNETAHKMHTPLGVQLINISKNGMRLRSQYNALALRNRFIINVKIGGSDTHLTAEVVDISNSTTEHSEFGCVFVESDPQ